MREQRPSFDSFDETNATSTSRLTDRHTDTDTDTETQTQTHRHRHTHRNTDTQIQTQTETWMSVSTKSTWPKTCFESRWNGEP